MRSNHFGAAALYARLAVDRGMVGIAMTNSTAKLVAPGGSKAITGSNPVAIGVPSHGEFPFLLDMSPAAVAGGKLLAGEGARRDDPARDGARRPG